MYIVGDFSQLRDSYPINEPTIKKNISKDDLIKARDDQSYQVINLITHTYFEPNKNTWKPLKSEV